MQQDNLNLILAIVFSSIIILVWSLYVDPTLNPKVDPPIAQNATAQDGLAPTMQETSPLQPQARIAPQAATASPTAAAASPRIPILSASLRGSVNLIGGRLDDLKLRRYRETIDPQSPEIVLFAPHGQSLALNLDDPAALNPGSRSPASRPGYFAAYGWSGASGVPVPDEKTPWTLERGETLTPQTPVVLRWNNGQGLIFRRILSVDDDYMFSIVQQVENNAQTPVALSPYGLVRRYETPEISGFFILHEGLIGYAPEHGLQEIGYDDLQEDGIVEFRERRGWLGITDKYWASALIPPEKTPRIVRYQFAGTEARPIHQTDFLIDPLTVAPGQRIETRSHLFAGAKVVSIVDAYQNRLDIDNFELLIDWGWFYFITRHLFDLIHYCYELSGNFGVAILIVTVLVKLLFFPLANKSYIAMSRMKLLQPEIEKLRTRYGDDKAAMQQKMMALYREKKINPAAGCLPIIVQIPVFFALYKVLFVTIEMRHAPFFGWVHDLAAPDPTSIFNLFGLLPWTPPALMLIGVWPCIMGVTMFVQMQMNPQPPDPLQAKIFLWMPLFFTALLASFPSGLVIYWTWNNILSILQQYVIMVRQGVKVELFDNLRALFARKPPPDSAPPSDSAS